MSAENKISDDRALAEKLRQLGFVNITGLKVTESSFGIEAGERIDAPAELMGKHIHFRVGDDDQEGKTLLITPIGRVWLRNGNSVEIPQPEVLCPKGVMDVEEFQEKGQHLAFLKISPEAWEARSQNPFCYIKQK